MGLWQRIKQDFKGNPRGYWFALSVIVSTIGFFAVLAVVSEGRTEIYWFAAVAIMLGVFFLADLALYYAKGEAYTLSATLRKRLSFITWREVIIGIAGMFVGIWLSHIFQFGANPRHDEENKALRAYIQQLQDANSNLKRELKAQMK